MTRASIGTDAKPSPSSSSSLPTTSTATAPAPAPPGSRHRRASPSSSSQSTTNPSIDPPSSVKQPPDSAAAAAPTETTGADAAAPTQPLAPPPQPKKEGNEGGDYFANGNGQNKSSHYSLEPNLFEQSFGKPPETPGKSILPPVASLTSPAPLTGNASLGGGYDWGGSLRSGPLSPAMLSGPTGPGDYFDSSLRGSFPTPNESSLRTGLTPGGGGSMFPAPSPNSQALFQSLASGGATPNTLDFHRTAMNAAAANKADPSNANATTRAATTAATTTTSMSATAAPAPANRANFANHDNEAANGLYLLAQAGNESQANNQFAVPNAPTNGQDKKRGRNAAPAAGNGVPAQGDDGSDADSRPSLKKAKKPSAAKSAKGKKNEDTPPKGAGKRAASMASMDDMDDYDEDEEDENGLTKDGRKMTDEEKRKNFLERNRVAALKCRQRKKQWLANLQAKVEIFSSENDQLNAQVNSLREEILNLKTILIAHKDCPIAQQQQIGQYMPQHQPDYNQGPPNPYGMQMQPGQPVMAGPRRYS